MKYSKIFKRRFGVNEYEMIDFPEKISGTKISRIRAEIQESVCPFCFPHGIETDNSRWHNMQRCWKTQRKKQWKE